MTFPTTALYASILTLMIVVTANIVSARRGRSGVSILHGDDMTLALWIRRHGNLIENAPLAMILMGLCEARGLGPAGLHAMGGLFVAARLAHLAGLHPEKTLSPLRLAGGVGSQLSLLGAVGYLLWSLI